MAPGVDNPPSAFSETAVDSYPHLRTASPEALAFIVRNSKDVGERPAALMRLLHHPDARWCDVLSTMLEEPDYLDSITYCFLRSWLCVDRPPRLTSIPPARFWREVLQQRGIDETRVIGDHRYALWPIAFLLWQMLGVVAIAMIGLGLGIWVATSRVSILLAAPPLFLTACCLVAVFPLFARLMTRMHWNAERGKERKRAKVVAGQ